MILTDGLGFARKSWRLFCALYDTTTPDNRANANRLPSRKWSAPVRTAAGTVAACLGGKNYSVRTDRLELAIKECAGSGLPKKNRVKTDYEKAIPRIDHIRLALCPIPKIQARQESYSVAVLYDHIADLQEYNFNRHYKGDSQCLVEQ